jgi:hypothetical protein
MNEKQKLEAEIKALIKEKEAQNKALKRFIDALTAKNRPGRIQPGLSPKK